jgi:CDP-paratose 2-epimerase
VVYNIGGSRFSNCSMLEAIAVCEEIAGRPMNTRYQDENRTGDHIWWISDTRRFRDDYPEWRQEYGIRRIFEDIFDGAQVRLTADAELV